jgi:hypothetical protein
MSFFSSAKAKLAASKLAEEQLYAQAAEEVASGQIRQGLWAKALAEADGDETAAKGRYLKLRVEIMRAEAEVTDYARKQAAKEADQAAREANQESARDRDSYSNEVEMARRFLYGEGYKLETFAGRFRVKDPAGGWADWKTEEELIEYAKERGCRL